MSNLWALYVCTTLGCTGSNPMDTGARFADFTDCREAAIVEVAGTEERFAMCYLRETDQAWSTQASWHDGIKVVD